MTAAGSWPAGSSAAASWPAADERLVRHYRRLLLAYSGHYRRRHGTEMITTLLEMAEPGRSWPSAGEAWHLIISGVRQRFRLPARPLVAVTAVLATVALGVFGLAAGSRLGERSSFPLPDTAGAVRLLQPSFGDPADSGATETWHNRDQGSADSLGILVRMREQRSEDTPNWTVEQARDGLAAAGWHITEFTNWGAPGPDETICSQPAMRRRCAVSDDGLRRSASITAERGGLVLHWQPMDSIGGRSGRTISGGGMGGYLYAERSAAYLPVTVAGGVLGALAGWLLVAALAFRLRPASPARNRAAGAITCAALAASAPPVWAIVHNAVRLKTHWNDHSEPVHTLHSVLQTGHYVQGASPWLIPGCALAAAAAVVAVGVLARGAGRTGSPGGRGSADVDQLVADGGHEPCKAVSAAPRSDAAPFVSAG